MAVYEGARPRPLFLPRRTTRPVPVVAPSRRRARGAVRARTRPARVSVALGLIVLAFLLAFFSLAQTVRVSATNVDVDRLLGEQAQLEGRRTEILSDLNRLGREPAIRKQAIDLGLSQLVEPLVVQPR